MYAVTDGKLVFPLWINAGGSMSHGEPYYNNRLCCGSRADGRILFGGLDKKCPSNLADVLTDSGLDGFYTSRRNSAAVFYTYIKTHTGYRYFCSGYVGDYAQNVDVIISDVLFLRRRNVCRGTLQLKPHPSTESTEASFLYADYGLLAAGNAGGIYNLSWENVHNTGTTTKYEISEIKRWIKKSMFRFLMFAEDEEL